MNDCTLDQTLYGALKDDLVTKRHVDMVFSYYNETTAMVEFTSECHRIALAAKSRSLHQILDHAGREIDGTTLIIVGQDSKPEAEDLFNMLYNPEASGEDITFWEDAEIVPLERGEAVPEFDCTPENNIEPIFSDEDIKEESLDDPLFEEDLEFNDTFEDEEECDLKAKPKYPTRDKICEPPKVLTYRMEGRNGKQTGLHELKLCSDEPLVKDRKTEQPVKSCLPKGLPGMDPFFYCTGFSISQSQRSQLERTNKKFGLTLLTVESLFAQGSEDIGHYKPVTKPSSEFRKRKLDPLTYQGSLIPYLSCRNCKSVVESMDMYSHALTCKFSPTKSDRQKKLPNDISIPHLENLIKNKDQDVAFKRNKYTDLRLGKLKKYMNYVVHKKYHEEEGKQGVERGRPSPFVYCRLCHKVMEEDGVSEHDCVKAISGITTIYESDKSRVSIVREETVNSLYLFIHPGTKCIKIGLWGKTILSMRKGLLEVLFS